VAIQAAQTDVVGQDDALSPLLEKLEGAAVEFAVAQAVNHCVIGPPKLLDALQFGRIGEQCMSHGGPQIGLVTVDEDVDIGLLGQCRNELRAVDGNTGRRWRQGSDHRQSRTAAHAMAHAPRP
jgi:hypothetical protein